MSYNTGSIIMRHGLADLSRLELRGKLIDSTVILLDSGLINSEGICYRSFDDNANFDKVIKVLGGNMRADREALGILLKEVILREASSS
ncbi:hypothetical protein GCM10027180_35200 [Microbulbifer echini]